MVKVGTALKSRRFCAISSSLMEVSSVLASCSISSGNSYGNPNSASTAWISVLCSPAFPSTLMISPKGELAFSGQSTMRAIAFCPCSTPLSFSFGMKMSTSIFLEDGTKKPKCLPISIVPTKSVVLRSTISTISPSSFFPPRRANKLTRTLSPFNALFRFAERMRMSLSVSGLTT